MENNKTIGLFGTCGNSTWRNKFMELYEERHIPYFNPQVKDWKPELADIEAWHLANDKIILFPVTGETYGTGSLAETGFSILNAISLNENRFVCIYIEAELNPELIQTNEIAAKESLRARKLVKAHLEKQNSKNLFIFDSLEEMMEASLELYDAISILEKVRHRANNNKRKNKI